MTPLMLAIMNDQKKVKVNDDIVLWQIYLLIGCGTFTTFVTSYWNNKSFTLGFR